MEIYLVKFAETESGIEMGVFTKYYRSLSVATQQLVKFYGLGAGEAIEMKAKVAGNGLYFFDRSKARKKARESNSFFFPSYIERAEVQ